MRNRKYSFILLLTLSIFSFITNVFGNEIEISGSVKFHKQISEALNLLKMKAPDEYAVIIKYIGRIEQGEKSGMWAYKNPPTYEIADRTAFYSITWCAGTIAHDSFHSKLYHEYKEKNKGSVPNAVWTGEAAEIKCLKHQVETLKKIGAPKREIDHCLKTKPNFFDFNKNGKSDWDDYEKRNW